jgi:hypothetical protein
VQFVLAAHLQTGKKINSSGNGNLQIWLTHLTLQSGDTETIIFRVLVLVKTRYVMQERVVSSDEAISGQWPNYNLLPVYKRRKMSHSPRNAHHSFIVQSQQERNNEITNFWRESGSETSLRSQHSGTHLFPTPISPFLLFLRLLPSPTVQSLHFPLRMPQKSVVFRVGHKSRDQEISERGAIRCGDTKQARGIKGSFD